MTSRWAERVRSSPWLPSPDAAARTAHMLAAVAAREAAVAAHDDALVAKLTAAYAKQQARKLAKAARAVARAVKKVAKKVAHAAVAVAVAAYKYSGAQDVVSCVTTRTCPAASRRGSSGYLGGEVPWQAQSLIKPRKPRASTTT